MAWLSPTAAPGTWNGCGCVRGLQPEVTQNDILCQTPNTLSPPFPSSSYPVCGSSYPGVTFMSSTERTSVACWSIEGPYTRLGTGFRSTQACPPGRPLNMLHKKRTHRNSQSSTGNDNQQLSDLFEHLLNLRVRHVAFFSAVLIFISRVYIKSAVNVTVRV